MFWDWLWGTPGRHQNSYEKGPQDIIIRHVHGLARENRKKSPLYEFFDPKLWDPSCFYKAFGPNLYHPRVFMFFRPQAI